MHRNAEYVEARLITKIIYRKSVRKKGDQRGTAITVRVDPLWVFAKRDIRLNRFDLCVRLSLFQQFVDFLSHFLTAGHGAHHEAGT